MRLEHLLSGEMSQKSRDTVSVSVPLEIVYSYIRETWKPGRKVRLKEASPIAQLVRALH